MASCVRPAPAVRRCFAAVALLASTLSASASETVETGFVRKTFQDADGAHGYVVYVPPDYTPARAWPVMLFLHGAGERGVDGFRQAEIGLGAMIRRWGGFPWIVVFPQVEDTRGPIITAWSPDGPDGRRALAILDEVERSYHVDPAHRVLTGWSMGGRGTYMLAAAFPDKWSAVVPIAGWADTELAPKLAGVPLWSFHGTEDSLVSYREDKALIEAIRESGGDPFFTTFPGGDHYIWRTIYASPVLFEWMSDPKRFADRKEPPELDPSSVVELPSDEVAGPFLPAIEIDNAVAIRIGPDVFRDLSEAASKEVAQKPLTGVMPGTATASEQSCVTFDVRTSPLRYRVPVTKAAVLPTEAGTLLIRVTIANARLVIGRTDVEGLLCRATAGPMHVVLGHRTPITVEAEAKPYVVDGVFRLRATEVRFEVDRENWYVTRPAVDSYSLCLPADRVAESLVDGVYANKPRIERDFRRSVRDAIDKLELELPDVKDDQLTTALWPVPAYRPRVRPRLQQVDVDEHGIAAVFGLTVAAVDPFGPAPALQHIDFGLVPADAGTGDIAVAAAEDLVAPITERLIDAGLAHINVLDIPDRKYAHLADRDVLEVVIPAMADLPETAEIRTELYLREPLRLNEDDEPTNACEPDGCFSIFKLRVPQLSAVISVRDSAQESWRDYAELSYDVTQSIRLQLGHEWANAQEAVSSCEGPPETRAAVRWLSDPPRDDRIDTEAAVRLFEQGWVAWSGACGPTAIMIPDLKYREYVRRLYRLESGPRGMIAVFEEAETVLSNKATVPFVYRTKRPDEPWGPPLTLSPGDFHAYRLSRPLSIESESGGRVLRYDVPPGRDATFEATEDGSLDLRLDPVPSPLRARGGLGDAPVQAVLENGPDSGAE